MENSIVIKVSYGDSIRRFNARIVYGKLDFNFDGLIAKLVSLFNFDHDNELTLTYIDEDGDKVTLADNEDLEDVVKQDLNPLRITVTTVMRAKSMIDDKKVETGTVKEALPSPSNSKAPNFLAFESKPTSTTGLFKKDKVKKIKSPSKTTSLPTKVLNNNFTPISDPYFDPRIPNHEQYSKCSGPLIRCDACGVYPITVPWFKSMVHRDYKICSNCFAKAGNPTTYVKNGLLSPPLLPTFQNFQNDSPFPAPQFCRGVEIKPSVFLLDSEFIMDINMVDGTTVQPLAPFSKIWRMRNNGKATWPRTIKLVWIGGHNLSSMTSLDVKIPVTGVIVGEEFDVCADFIAPKLPGRYVSHWRLASSTGVEFGQRIWVLIQVDASLTKTQPEINLSHICTSNDRVSGPKTENMEPKLNVKENGNSTVEDNKPNTENLKRKVPQYPLPFYEPEETCLPAFPPKEKEVVIKVGDSNVESAAAVEEDTSSDESWDSICDDLQEIVSLSGFYRCRIEQDSDEEEQWKY